MLTHPVCVRVGAENLPTRCRNFDDQESIRKNASQHRYLVPGAGIEPARCITPRDFKSLASTSSATQAHFSGESQGWHNRASSPCINMLPNCQEWTVWVSGKPHLVSAQNMPSSPQHRTLNVEYGVRCAPPFYELDVQRSMLDVRST